MVAQRSKRPIWRMQTGLCPYGHALHECYRREHGTDRCRYYDEWLRTYNVWRKGCARTFTGSDKHAGFPHGNRRLGNCAKVTLVCGDEVIYQRGLITWDGRLWCARCDEWQFVHEISASSKGKKALLFWPLDTVERTAPAPHIEVTVRA